MKIQKLLWVVMLTIGLGLCTGQPGIASDSSPDNDSVIQGNNAFAFDLYAQLTTEPGNLFVCPYSIWTALTMTYAGARNNTEHQMAQVLHLDVEQQHLHQAVQTWLNELNSSSNNQQGYQLHIANALWGQKGYGFLQDFLELTQKYYGAGLREVDFVRSVEDARKTINSWVEEQTQRKIRELIKPGILDASTTLVLTNAIYFKGNWALPFDEEKTVDAPFTLISGDTIEVPTMHQTVAANYFEDDTVQILELPYEGGQLSMILFLPNDLSQFPAFESAFSVKYIEQQLAKLRNQKVMVGIPRFSTISEFSLPEVLKAMGMIDAFSLPSADFSGMTGTRDLYISEVLHKAFVDVNEKGTEASAASAVAMSRGMGQSPIFQADHPFLFLIRHNPSRSILFLGRVMDPRG
jgi:serine protease inhibitor